MPPTPADLMLHDVIEEYAAKPADPSFTRLYGDTQFGHMFAILHEQLNDHFLAINGRAESTHHYWAENSRELLALIKNLKQHLHDLGRYGFDIQLDARYWAAMERCKPWLSPSGGSTVPDDFEAIQVVRHEAVFTRPTTAIKLKKADSLIQLQLVGEGSYAHVFSYTDPDYGIKFAVKRAKRDLDERDLQRFRQEYQILKRLSFPYIVEAYQYDEGQHEYRMEYCEKTLRTYINKRNTDLSLGTRKRLALQFLFALNYLHTQGVLHRDISLQNVLLKEYASGAVLVKLSDFGLAKDADSRFTHTHTEFRGTIRDPALDSLKDYAIVNEVYAIGVVLAYIFTGRERLANYPALVGPIIERCTAPNPVSRYQSVMEVITAVEALDGPTTGVPA